MYRWFLPVSIPPPFGTKEQLGLKGQDKSEQIKRSLRMLKKKGQGILIVGRKTRALRVDAAPLFRHYLPSPKIKTASALSADSNHQRNCNQPPHTRIKG
jgi:hypothetical protein